MADTDRGTAPVLNRSTRWKVGLFETATADLAGFEAGLNDLLPAGCEVATTSSYAALVDGLVEKTFDIAWLPPVAYVKAQAKRAAHLLATMDRGGAATYGCAVLMRAGLGDTLTAAQGKRVAWRDPWSASGYVVPRALLRDAGVDPDVAFASQVFVGAARAVVDALRDGTADIGAVHCTVTTAGTVKSGPWKDEDRVKVVALGGPIPCDALCAGPSVTTDERRALRTLLSTTPNAALLGALEATGMRDPDVRWYDIFRMAFLGTTAKADDKNRG